MQELPGEMPWTFSVHREVATHYRKWFGTTVFFFLFVNIKLLFTGCLNINIFKDNHVIALIFQHPN